MILTDQSVELINMPPGGGVVLAKACEFAGRNCYASQDKITEDSYLRFCRSLIDRGHMSPLEFGDLTFDITTTRAVLAEITRHRLASFCVESQRYIQEAKTGDITFVLPEWRNEAAKMEIWKRSMQRSENEYKELIATGAKPEEAREVLPNATACRIIMKANLREWRHIFDLRTSPAAYPQIRTLTKEMLRVAHAEVPGVFDDLYQQHIERN